MATMDAHAPEAWPQLQKAHLNVSSWIDLMNHNGSSLAHLDYIALQATWDYGKLAFCWGEGHKSRPKHFLGAYRKTPWQCPRCKTWLFTRKVRATSGVKKWLWYQVDLEVFNEHGPAILRSLTAERWPRDFADM